MAKKFDRLSTKVRSDPQRSARVDAHKRAIHRALALAQLRESRETTQKQLAEKLHVTQANVSRIERQEDLFLSTLAIYVRALGGELEIRAVFEDREIDLFSGIEEWLTEEAGVAAKARRTRK